MAILSVRNLTVGLGHPPLLDGVDFQIDQGERLALVGRNGVGKSTLLSVIAGETSADAGHIQPAPGLRVAQLPQAVPRHAGGSVFHAVAEGLGEAGALLERYQRLANAVAEGDTGRWAELERCQHEIEAAGAWTLNQQVEAVLTRLQLDPDADLASLSGGVARRVLLARALVSAPDLLLLDEPTNHLDIDSIAWLEQFLLEWNGALVFVTHDRAFLQRLATRILEIDRGKVTDYPGDYQAYLARKEAELASEASQNAEFDKRLAQEEAWIRQGIKARRKRNQGRVRALERMRQQRAERRQRTGTARVTIQEAERSGKLVAEAINVSFAYGTTPIIRDLDATILRGDKVGIVGPNGAGKTTLLRLLLGEIEPTTGEIRRGTNLQVAYFDQHRARLDDEHTVQEQVADGKEMVEVEGKRRHVLSYLQDFLFTPYRARQPVKTLSGGERNRLLLARLFTQPSNVLVLDEPTNDLDADTLELLEERVVDYKGTVLFVSHDRAFLDNVATSTLVFEGDAKVGEYVGGYSDWLRQTGGRRGSAEKGQTRRTPSQTKAAKPTRPTYKERRELEALPAHIESLEAARDALYAEMADPAFYQREAAEIAATQTRLAEIDSELESAFARWQALESQLSGGASGSGD